jgi:hypothetical protein
MRSLIICTFFFKKYYVNKMKKDEMGGICSTYGEINVEIFLFQSLKGRDCLEDVGVREGVVLSWILRK